MDTKAHGAHPEANNPSVRYSYIDSEPGVLWLIIRWWSGGESDYYFDFIDHRTRGIVTPPADLTVKVNELFGSKTREMAQAGRSGQFLGSSSALFPGQSMGDLYFQDYFTAGPPAPPNFYARAPGGQQGAAWAWTGPGPILNSVFVDDQGDWLNGGINALGLLGLTMWVIGGVPVWG
ncbi:uncharacterized protein STEHIDRAFT_153752 [Stereum hirsutum FP-91666 SS1]|uniref:uncharacterized protein n=1 Tax=Stereum hirsutum (strain FP-91666) TaxID=721885 RepID=UPI000440C178|nr:uncharacterized protein STEHIDRAFT_153752 [Stereum hirsutum FP-91666 SS1]EIM89915.1 hypothetical protein STEHIDRAFT_153752 [Stereum hirsutum FP-91666 SS1]